MVGLILIQTIWNFDGIPKNIFENTNFEKKSDDKNACNIMLTLCTLETQ